MNNIINRALKINKIDRNRYFEKLRTNPPIDKFIKSQEGFIVAIDNWSTILEQLLPKLPSDKEREPILENLFDEGGNGDITQSHVNTFRQFITSLGYKNTLEINYNYPSSPAVKKFNQGLHDALNYDHWIFCSAMLGIIEYIYITVSRNIHKYSSQYVQSDKLLHYGLHEIIDDKHSTDLFKMVAPYYDNYGEEITTGIIYGYNLMNDLYNELSVFL